MRISVNRVEILRVSAAIALGLLVSFVLCAGAKAFMASRSMASQKELAAIVSQRQPSIFYAGASQNREKTDISFASFGVPDADPEKRAPLAVAQSAPVGSIKDFKLFGTLPSIGVWIETKSGSSFVLKNGGHDGYILSDIAPDMAIFTRDGESFPLYLTFWSPADKRPAAAARAMPRAPDPAPVIEAPNPESGIVLAEANGSDGTITRELLNDLLTNPLNEVRKMRLVPADNGMMIMGMRSDSLFSKLGMQPNDVITNVNGIGIDDVGNVSNVISSMLSGARLDFQVEREGEPLKLGYAVK
ncbi:MAG: PDZ domain-containing protein [Synergistaceae bacterium]|jgi:S1-C subfamily serine protease|nr:PDZ domain-containing protein [Synergistaceae bacterium]